MGIFLRKLKITMIKKFLHIFCALLLLSLSIFSMPLDASAIATNLIANPSVETASNEQPVNWSTNSWGTNTPTFSFSENGNTGGRSLMVSVSNHQNGDAKWMSDQVQVTPGQTYVYTDYSKSDVYSELDAAYTHDNGEMTFEYIQSIPASVTWTQNNASFTVPDGVVSVSIYHILYSDGTLQTDDFSLSLSGVASPDQPPTTNPETPTAPLDPSTEPIDNLLTNPSFEVTNGNDPADWSRGSWGINTPRFSYDNGNARTGQKSISLTILSVSSGDAKWYASPVSVTSGKTYTYQDYYKSNVATRLVVVMSNTDGTNSYTELTQAAVADTWTLYSGEFTVPSGIEKATVYHLIDSVGSLSIDDVSLIANSEPSPVTQQPASSNLITNPDFETTSGSHPIEWRADKWGTNTSSFAHVKDDGHTDNSSSKVTISDYVNGDAKWIFSPITTLTPGAQYEFSAWYKTNSQPRVVVAYEDENFSSHYQTLASPIPGADATTNWQNYHTSITAPYDAVSLTVYVLLASNGWLQTDDYSIVSSSTSGFDEAIISITFDDGWSSIYKYGLPLLRKYDLLSTQYIVSGKLNTSDYMTNLQVQSIKNEGHEIGSHTVSHPDLTTLDDSDLTAELQTSQASLKNLTGEGAARSVASPYGVYNAATLGKIRQSYQSHRSTDTGYNDRSSFNPYNILVQNILSTTTPEDMRRWVEHAKTTNTWLVIVYHAVGPTESDNHAVTSNNLDLELNIIKNSGVKVQTISQAIYNLSSQL
jgi:peptidoglycan/xylan/chitin deacetylase (PgdA/CDA1 family)